MNPENLPVATWLRLVALAEPLTLAILLINVSLVHNSSVAGAIGPVHGGCYLAIIIGFLMRVGTPVNTRLLAVIPGVGGLLALRATDRARADAGTTAHLVAVSDQPTHRPAQLERTEHED